MKYKELTACVNLVSVLYSYAFQFRDDIFEIEQTIYDFRNVLLEFYEKQPDEDDFFLLLIKNIKTNLEKMNQIFIGNEFKFKHWNKEDQINLFEMDFCLKQQKEQIEKEYLRYHYLIESFEIDHPDARDFFKKSFGEKKFVSIDDFFVAFQNETSEIEPNTLEVMKRYIDFSSDGLVGIFKFYKFLNYFGNLKKMVENIQLLIDKGIHIYNFSSLRATKELKNAKKGSYLIRFSKSHSNCFAISFKNDKNQIKHILVSCYKSGLKLKHSEKIFGNLYEFLLCNCKILRQEQCEKGCQTLAKKEDNKIVEVHKKGEEQHLRMCSNCKRAYTDTV